MATRKLSITDMFGNTIIVTALIMAIAQAEASVPDNATNAIKPFKFVNGIAVTIPERSSEAHTVAEYHNDLLAKVEAVLAQDNDQGGEA